MDELCVVTDSCRQFLLAGRPADARRLAGRALTSHPGSARLRHLYATACLSMSDWGEAETALRVVLAQDGGKAQAWDHLGVALHHQRRHGQARDAFERSLTLAAGVATTWSNAASNAFDGGLYAEALRCAERALELDDGLAPAWLAKGNALLALARPREAALCLERAVALPGAGPAERSSLAMAWSECGRGDEAVEMLQDLLVTHPEQADARFNLALVHYRAGRVRAALDLYRAAVGQDPDNAAAWSAWLFALTHCDDCAPEEVFAAHRRFGQHFARISARSRRHEHLSRDPQRRLRIGFVSGDLREHPVARFIAPVWRLLRAAGFDIVAYHTAPFEDGVSGELRALTDGWESVHALDDGALAHLVEADAIDILFDLSGHTAYNRLPVFARRPAPVQISWMGYPATTGLDAIDYRLVNAHALPPDEGDAWFTERLIRLRLANAFEPPADLPAVTPLPARRNGAVSFGSFARAGKVTPATIALWSAVLRALPESRMIVGGMDEAGVRDRIAALFEGEGVPATRIELRPRLSRDDYLRAHADVDVLLDTTPYSGGTSVSYGLWMGVPTIAFAPPGAPLHQRHGAGMLAEAGLPEWIAGGREAFVECAVRASADLPALEALRHGLRARMLALRTRQSRDDELPVILRRMWRAWCAGDVFEAPR
ncbi:O-linked N-acetylglucosamine transferase, SPINDLY family protein [Pseudazoarcus pumilus]|uniref:protein O-GlcNAc transferase n=1 Tax=Pseudazoarcus pumilus TaxID=2067960 RepID=A0A2I6S7L3_9RHOO|nr:tetratricopeptide repeat protein [Pseudazoarcus pumilus]AUN95238.1 hypothetical protein C0099_10040 [Pseudazoarcus pumilus]